MAAGELITTSSHPGRPHKVLALFGSRFRVALEDCEPHGGMERGFDQKEGWRVRSMPAEWTRTIALDVPLFVSLARGRNDGVRMSGRDELILDGPDASLTVGNVLYLVYVSTRQGYDRRTKSLPRCPLEVIHGR